MPADGGANSREIDRFAIFVSVLCRSLSPRNLLVAFESALTALLVSSSEKLQRLVRRV